MYKDSLWQSLFDDFVHHLTDNEHLQIITDPIETPFKFGHAPVVRSVQFVRIPVVMTDKSCTIQTEIVERNNPLLLIKESLRKVQTKSPLQITVFQCSDALLNHTKHQMVTMLCHSQ